MIHKWKPGLANGDEVAFLADRLDVLGSGSREERGEPEILSLADLPGRKRIHSRVWEVREQFSRWNQGFFNSALGGQILELLQCVRVFFGEFPGAGSPKFFQKRPATQPLSHLVSDAAQIRSG